jgi:hypothetical protein
MDRTKDVTEPSHVVDVLPPDAMRVITQMREGWGYPLSHYAADAGVPEKRTAQIVRAFAAFGWAERHQFFSEDDNLVRGSGYSLTAQGAKIEREVMDRLTKDQQP